MRRIFTRGLAFAEGFCNRTREIQELRNNIKNGTHTLLSSPRRYGKTSLALNAIEKEKIPYSHIDLFMKYGKEEIQSEFYSAISRLWSQLVKPSEKMLKKIESFLQHIKISLEFGRAGLEFSLAPYNENKSLKFLFEGLDAYLEKNKKTAIIFIDEMQGIAESTMCDEIESTLRFIAQKTKNLVFIFSGSNRHLLSMLFEDKNRPFYKLCHPLPIHKIAPEHYFKHINKFAVQKWREKLDVEALTKITTSTYCHPYYVNVLCEKLFQLDQLPMAASVQQCWDQVCYEEQGALGRDLEFLTGKQKQLLTEIARQDELREPTAKEFVSKVDLTAKGVLDALKTLYRYDLIEKDEKGIIKVIDPVIGYWATR